MEKFIHKFGENFTHEFPFVHRPIYSMLFCDLDTEILKERNMEEQESADPF